LKVDERGPADLEGYRRRLEADLEIAELVHRSMIPSNMRRGELEIACNFTPMIGVGGDYSSVYFQDDRHVRVGICDVSGHGVAAALLASRVNSFVLNIAPSARHPCDVVVALNEFIYLNFGQTGLYLTFFSLFIDLETRVLSYSGCGHPPVLRYSKKKNNVVRLESENGIIGAFEDLSPTCVMLPIPFERGDRLVLYTDGITDAENPDGAILGVDGLEGYLKETAHLQPEQWVDAIVRRVEDFRSGLPATDDQLLLSISSVGDA
jgi:sigma-B regulation protein RsbU (phosphoserine phosphatase)